ncbi:MAG: hypothetical protein JWQ49_6269 [Edaphobacter sp.]|nr:hypothetical protein [Edaphobacter sp.]
MNNQKGGPEVYWRGSFAFALLGLIILNLGMIAHGVAWYPALLFQSGARTFVAEPIGVLVAYAIAVVCIARTHGAYWDGILRTAIIFGLLAGTLEIINIGIENGIPFAVRGPALQIVFMLSIFTSWGIAGFRTARSLGSGRAGLLAAVCSAGICMLIAVAAGFLIQFFLVPPKPEYVSTWSEFKRSGWTDPRAFEVANTLDSGFTHLIIAPVNALAFGGVASLLARFTLSRTASF